MPEQANLSCCCCCICGLWAPRATSLHLFGLISERCPRSLVNGHPWSFHIAAPQILPWNHHPLLFRWHRKWGDTLLALFLLAVPRLLGSRLPGSPPCILPPEGRTQNKTAHTHNRS